jgi:hypothetical protein
VSYSKPCFPVAGLHMPHGDHLCRLPAACGSAWVSVTGITRLNTCGWGFRGRQPETDRGRR